MTDDEISQLAHDALEAAQVVIRRQLPNRYTGDPAGHLFKLHDELRAYIRDEMSSPGDMRTFQCRRCHGSGLVTNRLGIEGIANCPECRP